VQQHTLKKKITTKSKKSKEGAFFAAVPQKTGLSASSPRKAPMRFLWAFRCNPLRRAAGEFAECKFAASPLARRQLENQALKLPMASSGAHNCHRQLCAYNSGGRNFEWQLENQFPELP
jgi:hypothetical protein